MIEIPEIPAGASVYEAALVYCAAGLYVGPLAMGTKNPGSVLGKGWQHQSSRDPEQLREWFDGTDADVFIHCGRSGLIVIDVDYPEQLPAVLADNLGGAPHQATRPDDPGRGHYLFAQPEGRRFGNGQGRLGSAWGDIRGANGVIVAEPSIHGGGGEYRWMATGPVPVLPDAIAEQLTEPSRARSGGSEEAADAATDAEVASFIENHTAASRPGALSGRVKGFREYLAAGNGRHTGVGPFLTGATEEAVAGLYSAGAVVDALGPMFIEAATADGTRSIARAHAEFYSYLAWAIGQARSADPDEIRKRVEDAMGIDGEAAYEDILRNSAKGSQPAGPTKAKPARPKIWRADDLDPAAPLKWLGVRHIPEAAVTLLTGDEGIGKSLLWCRIAACISSGNPMPEFGIPKREPRHVLVVVTEDDWTTVVRPRLALAGASLAYVSVVCSSRDGTGPPSFPSDMDIVEAADPRPYLIVVDAWVDALDSSLTVKDAQHARQALGPWSEIAGKFRSAVILLTHTNRGTGTSIRERYALTSELRKKARMALFAQQDEVGRLVVGPDKSNLAGGVNASLFKVEVVKVFDATDDGDGTIGKVVYVGDAGRTAAALLADLAAPPPREGAEGFAAITLKTVLEDGKAHDRAEVMEKLATAGIPESTAKRAADKLGVVKDRKGFPATSTWQLPVSSPVSPSISDGLTELTEPTRDYSAPSVSSVSSVSSAQTDGPTDELTDTHGTVEKPDYPICTGACGLPIGPHDIELGRTHHGFCS